MMYLLLDVMNVQHACHVYIHTCASCTTGYIPFMHPRRPPQSRQMSASFLLRRVVVGAVCRIRMEVRLLFSHQMFCWLISKQSRIWFYKSVIPAAASVAYWIKSVQVAWNLGLTSSCLPHSPASFHSTQQNLHLFPPDPAPRSTWRTFLPTYHLSKYYPFDQEKRHDLDYVSDVFHHIFLNVVEDFSFEYSDHIESICT